MIVQLLMPSYFTDSLFGQRRSNWWGVPVLLRLGSQILFTEIRIFSHRLLLQYYMIHWNIKSLITLRSNGSYVNHRFDYLLVCSFFFLLWKNLLKKISALLFLFILDGIYILKLFFLCDKQPNLFWNTKRYRYF